MNGIINPVKIVTNNFISGVNPDNIQPNSIDLTVSNVYTINGTLVLFADKKNRRQLPEYTPLKSFSYPVDIEFKNSVQMYVELL